MFASLILSVVLGQCNGCKCEQCQASPAPTIGQQLARVVTMPVRIVNAAAKSAFAPTCKQPAKCDAGFTVPKSERRGWFGGKKCGGRSRGCGCGGG